MACSVVAELWACECCLFAACNGDSCDCFATKPGQSPHATRVSAGLDEIVARFGGHASPDFDSETGEGINEFSWRPCGICGSHLGGSRHRFAVLAYARDDDDDDDDGNPANEIDSIEDEVREP